MQNNQWLILIFFPMAYSFICPGEIVAFNARQAEFSAKSTAVLFASTDSEHVLKAWNATPIEEGGLGGVSVPLLSDRQRRLAKEYGVLIEEEGIAQRGVFVIDPTGIIRWLSVSDANVGRSVDEILRVLDALKFTGESLPLHPISCVTQASDLYGYCVLREADSGLTPTQNNTAKAAP